MNGPSAVEVGNRTIVLLTESVSHGGRGDAKCAKALDHNGQPLVCSVMHFCASVHVDFVMFVVVHDSSRDTPYNYSW